MSIPFSETLLRISSLQLSESAISTIVDFGVSSWSIISSTAPIPSFSPSLSISIASSTGSLAIFSSMFSSIAVSSNSYSKIKTRESLNSYLIWILSHPR